VAALAADDRPDPFGRKQSYCLHQSIISLTLDVDDSGVVAVDALIIAHYAFDLV
jgi:hypothetical protein